MQKLQYLLKTFLFAELLLLQAATDYIDELSVLLRFDFEVIGPDYVSGESGLIVRLVILLVSELI